MYTTFDKQANGTLRISLTAEGREELVEQVRQQGVIKRWHDVPFHMPSRPDRQMRSNAMIFYKLIEHQLCNGWLSVIPEMIGALTSNPYMLTDDYGILEDPDTHDDVYDIDTIYHFADYRITDPLDLLERDGYVDFAVEHASAE